MKNFEIIPQLVPADQRSVVKIIPCAGHSLKEFGNFAVHYCAHENLLPDGRIVADIDEQPQPSWHEENGELVIEAVFAGEQEHSIDLVRTGTDSSREVLAAFRIYSVKEDLRGLKPYRGNFHQHSTNSRCCHAPEDTPAHVAAESRRIGLDFTTISDHSYYNSVSEAKSVYGNVPLDLALFPGEEVHPMQWSQHIVNFGGSHGICAMIEADKEKFYREVEEIRKKLHLPDNMDQFVISAVQWAFARIHEAGGIAILSHPYWYYYHRGGLMVSPVVTDELIRLGGYDAMEVISGFYYDIAEYNNWQIVRWFEEKAKGHNIPPLGVNDSHRCQGEKSDFNWYSTILLAESVSFEDIRSAVKACRCAAVESLPGAPVKLYTDLRLVKYLHFLLREYFPEHDALCRKEGLAMDSFCKGEPGAEEQLRSMKGTTEAWRRKFMGKLYSKDSM